MRRGANQLPLDRLAEAHGVQLGYQAEGGEWRTASDDEKRAVLQVMGIDARGDDAVARSLAGAPTPPQRAIVAPEDVLCYLPEWLADGRAWGVTCQLYGLRSARNHGIGDFEDLARLAESLAAQGADFVGVNPLHALFTADPERCSPFSPSNRRFINPLYIALDEVPGTTFVPTVDETVRARLSAAKQINYREVAALKLDALRSHWKALVTHGSCWAPGSRARFDAFVRRGGDALLMHARFEALSRFMVANGNSAGWQGWPETYRDCHGEAVRRFATENADEVRFHLWLQWVADSQLADVARRAHAAGMRIGLYLDFAVGTAPDGSATWTNPTLVVAGASIGAPPDSFFEHGQDWGLAPLSPTVLRQQQFVPYRTELESVMRHAGAIRIDHAMGLHRLYWIPHGGTPETGCYVLYPVADMLGALAAASIATDTVVIGEDMGTVPRGFAAVMHGVNMHSYKVLYFERSRGGFRTARSFEKSALLSASTHDLPTLAGWWKGSDITLFQSLGLLDDAGARSRRTQRRHDRCALLARLRRELARCGPAFQIPDANSTSATELTTGLAAAVHAYLARTPCRLLAVQFEDLCGAEAPVNVPGTSDQYPNWRLRAPAPIETASQGEHWFSIIEAVNRERPRQS